MHSEHHACLGFFKLPGLTMLAMYLLGIVVALLMAWLFKKTLLKGETPMLIMELPPYKRPLAARRVAPHVGPLEALSAPRRHGDSRHQHPALVSGHLSAQRGNEPAIRSPTQRDPRVQPWARLTAAAAATRADQLAALDKEETRREDCATALPGAWAG